MALCSSCRETISNSYNRHVLQDGATLKPAGLSKTTRLCLIEGYHHLQDGLTPSPHALLGNLNQIKNGDVAMAGGLRLKISLAMSLENHSIIHSFRALIRLLEAHCHVLPKGEGPKGQRTGQNRGTGGKGWGKRVGQKEGGGAKGCTPQATHQQDCPS